MWLELGYLILVLAVTGFLLVTWQVLYEFRIYRQQQEHQWTEDEWHDQT